MSSHAHNNNFTIECALAIEGEGVNHASHKQIFISHSIRARRGVSINDSQVGKLTHKANGERIRRNNFLKVDPIDGSPDGAEVVSKREACTWSSHRLMNLHTYQYNYLKGNKIQPAPSFPQNLAHLEKCQPAPTPPSRELPPHAPREASQ